MQNHSPGSTDSPATPAGPASSLLSARRRRDKVQLSCTLCRRRKLKCDRSQPCGTCVHRGLSLSCTYVKSLAQQRAERHMAAPSVVPGGMQDRITQLEGLVISLMSSLNAVKSTEAVKTTELTPPAETLNLATLPSSVTQKKRDESALPQDLAQLSVNLRDINLETPGVSHDDTENWAAILDGIGALKDQFDDEPDYSKNQHSPAANLEETDLIFGGYGSDTKQQILAAMPPRAVVDKLVTKCFASMEMAPVIIHRPTFLKEYEQFWNKPMDTPLMWIGLLFGIMCSATNYQQLSPKDSDSVFYVKPASELQRLSQLYRAKTIQCIVMREYNKYVPYTLETFLIYIHANFLSDRDNQMETLLSIGLIVRIAQRMGCHRDVIFPWVSPFQAEMQRRVWAVIFRLEVLASSWSGLPRILQNSHCNACEPRNLLDEDFGPDMVELPPARPDTSFTAVQYFVATNKIVWVFGLILNLEHSIQPCSHAEVMRLDVILQDAYDSLPHWLIMRPLSQLLMDTPDAIMRRIYTALLFNKAKCVLHRKYLVPGKTDSSYSYSRTTCIDAALQILRYQQIMDQESQAGGRLHQDRWKVSSLVKADFLLATNLLCMDLDMPGMSPSEPSDAAMNEVVVHALADSYQIWLRPDSSPETRKAVELLQNVLGKRSTGNMPITVGESLKTSKDPSAGPATMLDPERSSARLYPGVLSPMVDMGDTDKQTTGADIFEFVDWDTGYGSPNNGEMKGSSLSYPLMFGFPI